MVTEVVTLNRLRLEEDRSYNDLARAIGFKDTSVLHKLMRGKTEPSARSLYKIRKFLAARKTRKGVA